ncbi:MAG: ATP-dependent RecD-like DNA helicase, partial [Chloroflexi bacterium]|nr:ATP-dependent RecD-like DNA helicase [Chloroflexota bacterium]
MPTLRGTVERITYYNPENGYTVLRLRPARPVAGMARDGLITVVGELPELSPGEHLELTGQWKTHTRYGRQFVAETCRQTLPATAEGI